MKYIIFACTCFYYGRSVTSAILHVITTKIDSFYIHDLYVLFRGSYQNSNFIAPKFNTFQHKSLSIFFYSSLLCYIFRCDIPARCLNSVLSTSGWGRCCHGSCGRSGHCRGRYRGSACFHFVNHNPGTADQCWYQYHDQHN